MLRLIDIRWLTLLAWLMTPFMLQATGKKSKKLEGSHESGETQRKPQVLTQEEYSRIGFGQVQELYPDKFAGTLADYNIRIVMGMSVDLNRDNVVEILAAAEVDEPEMSFAFVFYYDEDQWKCRILHAKPGGGILHFEVVDMNADGQLEIISIMHDENYRKELKVMRFSNDETAVVEEIFNLLTKDNLNASANVSLVREEDSSIYKIRVDETSFNEGDGGDVVQRVSFYVFTEKGIELEETITRAQSL